MVCFGELYFHCLAVHIIAHDDPSTPLGSCTLILRSFEMGRAAYIFLTVLGGALETPVGEKIGARFF